MDQTPKVLISATMLRAQGAALPVKRVRDPNKVSHVSKHLTKEQQDEARRANAKKAIAARTGSRNPLPLGAVKAIKNYKATDKIVGTINVYKRSGNLDGALEVLKKSKTGIRKDLLENTEQAEAANELISRARERVVDVLDGRRVSVKRAPSVLKAVDTVFQHLLEPTVRKTEIDGKFSLAAAVMAATVELAEKVEEQPLLPPEGPE
jgi:hypothetical protein